MKTLRRVPFQHAYNVRDLGGYATVNGMTAWNRLYRSDHLCDLNDQEWQQLADMKISLIIDLRSNSERKTASYDARQIRVLHIPFMKQEAVHPTSLQGEALDEFLQSMKLDYVKMIHNVHEELRQALHEIAIELKDGGNVLFHCSAGKDRTGMLAAILLSICGVNTYDILADYQVSETYNEIGVNQMLSPEMMKLPEIKALFESRVGMLTPLLDEFHKEGIEQWLFACGVDQADIQWIKQHMIEK